MSGFAIRLNLSGQDKESLERGDNVYPGWYLAELKDVFEDQNKPNTVFRFAVVGGAMDGFTVSYWLPSPDSVEDNKRARAGRRVALVAKRLGLLNDADYGQPSVEKSWLDALHTQVFLHVTKAKDGFVGIAYDGIYPLDDDKLPKEFPKELEQHRRAKVGAAAGGPGPGQGNGPPAMPNAEAEEEDEFAGL
jgi:hypothetical protein